VLLNALLPAGLIKDARLIRRQWQTAIFLSVVVNVLVLVQPLFMLHVYDYVLPSQSVSTLFFLTIIAIFVVAAASVLDYLRSRVLIDLGREIDLEVRERAFRGAFEQGIATRRFSRASFVADLESLRSFISGPSAVALIDLPWTPIYIIALFMLSMWLGILALVATFVVLGIVLINERSMNPVLSRATKASQVSARLADDVLLSSPASQSMGFTDRLLMRWASAARYAGGLNESANITNSGAAGWVKFIRQGLQILSLAVAAILVLQQKMTPGSIVAASIIGARAVGPLESCVAAWRRFLSVRIALKTLEDQVFLADTLEANRTTLPPPTGEIAAQNITITDVERRQYILQGINFQVPAGSYVGIIGRSGSGKSTLLQALAGALHPTAGAVRFDGADAAHWRRADLGPHIGFLPQSVQLHRGTVAENIRRFGPVDDEATLAAAQLSGAHEMIVGLPDGYNSDIGEQGSLLSGGMQQRIGLARAVYGNPMIYMFDEPTAHLDPRSETLFWRMVSQLKQQGKTIFLITHNPAHVQSADFLAFLADGRLRNFGPKNEVMRGVLPNKEQEMAEASEGAAKP
jgi:PrtD family type I secretion system ABC transporter